MSGTSDAPRIFNYGEVQKYTASENFQKMNFHSFRAAKDIYDLGLEGQCWITKVQQMEDKGTLVDWGLQGVGNTLYLSFKGTDGELTDIITDLAAVYGTVKYGQEIFKVHLGFKNFVDEVYDDIITLIKRNQNNYKFSRLCVTGHSLGGGVAQLFALRYLSEFEISEFGISELDCKLPFCNWRYKDRLPRLSYVPTFAAPMVLFESTPILKPLDGSIYKKWSEVCVNFIYQWDIVAFTPRSIPGILEHMKSTNPFSDLCVAFITWFNKDDDSEVFQKSFAFAKNIIGHFVKPVNLEYLKGFKGISSKTVFLYNPEENNPKKNSSHIKEYSYYEVSNERVNNLALHRSLNRFHGENIEKIVLPYHQLSSYENALKLYNSTLADEIENMSCSANNIWV